ncbi:hypothetical protein SNEBB_008512 [Seison nebaliae]|nr:hypothetical protein SNEBB_008512 [Seison nebaliae]
MVEIREFENEHYSLTVQLKNVNDLTTPRNLPERCSENTNGINKPLTFYSTTLIQHFREFSNSGAFGIERRNDSFYWADRFQTKINNNESCNLWAQHKPNLDEKFIIIRSKNGKFADNDNVPGFFCMKFQMKKLSFKLNTRNEEYNELNRKRVINILYNLNSIDPKILFESSTCYEKRMMIGDYEYIKI